MLRPSSRKRSSKNSASKLTSSTSDPLAHALRPVVESLEQRQMLTVTPAGLPDSTFNATGSVTTDFGIHQNDDASAILVQNVSGATKYLVVGTNSSTHQVELARYNRDGTLDASFGVNGTVTTPLTGFQGANAAAFAANGDILVAGSAQGATTDQDFVLVRYSSNGALQTTWGAASLTGSTTTTTSGFFDVFIGVTGTGNGNLESWQTQVFLDTSAGQPTGLSLGTPTVTDVVPNSRTMALHSDSSWATPNGTDTNTASQASSTQSVATAVSLDTDNGGGFMRVPFTVAAGATGTFHVTLDPSDVTGTALFDSSFNEIPYTAVNGTVTVSVPEPASLGLLAFGATGLLTRRRGRA